MMQPGHAWVLGLGPKPKDSSFDLVRAAEKLPIRTWQRWFKSLDAVAEHYVVHVNPRPGCVVAYAFPRGQWEYLYGHTLRIVVDQQGVRCSESDLGVEYALHQPRIIKDWIKKVEAR